MNKKLFSLVMLISLLALSLVFVSCDNGITSGGGGGDTPNVFTITGITTQLRNWSQNACIVGLYPVDTTVEQALSDTKRIYELEPGSPQYIVAGREVYHNNATGTENNWTQTGTLTSASSGFTNNWRGSGTFIAYWLLQDAGNTYRVLKSKTSMAISEGDNTSVHAVNDFDVTVIP